MTKEETKNKNYTVKREKEKIKYVQNLKLLRR
jgi:hypothetical protein